jgi:hypothetical protein
MITVACSGDSDDPAPAEKEKLALLSRTWTLQSAHQSKNRTGEFKDPDFTLTLSGDFKEDHPEGPYAYAVSGSLPDPSPWDKNGGLWTFGEDPATTLVRDDQVVVHYTLSGTTLTLTFTCATCDTDNGRVNSAEGNWVFVFNAAN